MRKDTNHEDHDAKIIKNVHVNNQGKYAKDDYENKKTQNNPRRWHRTVL